MKTLSDVNTQNYCSYSMAARPDSVCVVTVDKHRVKLTITNGKMTATAVLSPSQVETLALTLLRNAESITEIEPSENGPD